MKKFGIFFVIMVLIAAVVAVWVYLLQEKEKELHIVKFTGVNTFEVFNDYFFHMEKGDTTVGYFPAFEGDHFLVSTSFEDNGEYIYEYKESDGELLKFQSRGPLLFLNEKLISLTLGDGPLSPVLIDTLDTEAIGDLRYIVFECDSCDTHMDLLKKISQHNPDIGLLISEYSLPVEILRMFNPYMIFSWEGEYLEELLKKDNMEVLSIEVNLADQLDQVMELPNLRRLIIKADYLPDITTKILNAEKIKSLGLIINEEIQSNGLDLLRSFTGLEELYLRIDSIDANVLKDMRNLVSLHFDRDMEVSNLGALNEMHDLKYVSLPYYIEQDELNDFSADHPEIEALIIPYFEGMDLSPLKKMDKLSFLCIYDDEDNKIEVSNFEGLETLDYLAINYSAYQDSLYLLALQKQLPDTIIQGEGMCMGTGRILFIFPILILLAASYFLLRKFRN